ncbi:unnamed protein product [Schistocephalus solidus]|uniref:F5/8 type C domain-containing protein n=1 Tax=Schistocephalus solidus TaxID=70667 RepID=A0A183T901_SCHSO|nr:unnamed protein product [Schistocephalus solidus]
MWEALGSPETKPTAVRVWASNNTQMQFEGVFQTTLVFEDKACLTDIYALKSENDLLGNKTIPQLGLWSRPFQEMCSAVNITEEELKKKYAERIGMSVGTCTKTTGSLRVKPEKKPVFSQSRRVQFAVQSAVEEELEHSQQNDIIYPTNYSAWAAPIVEVKKANGIITVTNIRAEGYELTKEDTRLIEAEEGCADLKTFVPSDFKTLRLDATNYECNNKQCINVNNGPGAQSLEITKKKVEDAVHVRTEICDVERYAWLGFDITQLMGQKRQAFHTIHFSQGGKWTQVKKQRSEIDVHTTGFSAKIIRNAGERYLFVYCQVLGEMVEFIVDWELGR